MDEQDRLAEASIEVRVGTMIGSRFRRVGRAADSTWLQFGETAKLIIDPDETRVIYEHALHLRCPFRLDDPSDTLLASHDMYFPANDPPSGDAGNAQSANYFDAQALVLQAKLDADPYLVEDVHADRYGGLRVIMSGGLTLTVFPATSLRREHWRYSRPYQFEEHLRVFDEDVSRTAETSSMAYPTETVVTDSPLRSTAEVVCAELRAHAAVCEQAADDAVGVIRQTDRVRMAVRRYEAALMQQSGWTSPFRFLDDEEDGVDHGTD